MTLVVKPISGQLTKDKDTFGKSVRFIISRIPMSRSLSDPKNRGLKLIQEVEKLLTGPIL